MSINQMVKVWEHHFSRGEQAVMLCLADHAHEDGTNIRPGVDRVAWKTEYSPRQVTRIIKELVSRGVLKMTREGGGRAQPNVYKIDWTKAQKKEPYTPVNPDTMSENKNPDISVNPDICDTETLTSATLNPDIAMSPEPLEPSLEPSMSPTGAKAPKDVGRKTRTGTGSEKNLGKHYLTMTIDRVREVDFDPTDYQKQNWGKGWKNFATVEVGNPPSSAECFARMQRIVAAASDGYFLSVEKAGKKERTPQLERTGPVARRNLDLEDDGFDYDHPGAAVKW